MTQNNMRLVTVNSVAARYSTSLNRDTLYAALNELLGLEPILSTNVFFAQTGKPVLKKLEAVDLEKVIFFRPGETYNDEFVNTLYDNTEPLQYDRNDLPLWRIYVLGESQQDVVWIFDHAIFDGMSGVYFHEKLLKSLRKGNPKIDTSVIKATPIALHQSIEHLAEVSPGIGSAFKHMISGAVHPHKKHPQPSGEVENLTIPWAEPAPQCPPKSKTVLVHLSSEQTNDLLDKAHSLDITFTSLVYACVMQSVLEWVPQDNSNYTLQTAIPFNARPFFKKPSRATDLLGNFIFYHTYPLTISSTCRERVPRKFVPTWAKEFDKELKHYKGQTPSPLGEKVGGLKFANMKKKAEAAVKSPRETVAEISNLGQITFDEDTTETTISELSYVQPATTLGSSVTVCIASVKDGNTTIAISVAGDDGSFTKTNEFREALRETLTDAVNSTQEPEEEEEQPQQEGDKPEPTTQEEGEQDK